jgi:hypothetical protein
MGFTREARMAGSHVDTSATASSNTGATTNATGSSALT